VSVEQMLQQVAGKALITLRDGQSEMRLQLTPPDLGRMEMKIVLEDGQMMGKIVVSTPEAKALFDQNLGELQRQLQQAGVQVGSLDVSLGQPGDDKQPEPAFGSTRSFQGEGEVIATEGITSSSLWTDARVNYIV
jgi:flagellar hook-length control protein FliK